MERGRGTGRWLVAALACVGALPCLVVGFYAIVYASPADCAGLTTVSARVLAAALLFLALAACGVAARIVGAARRDNPVGRWAVIQAGLLAAVILGGGVLAAGTSC